MSGDARGGVLLSILVPTLVERDAVFARLHATLSAQIDRHGLADRVEIRSLRDNRERTTGDKRNALIAAAAGGFVVFADDDDDVHDDYVGLIAAALRAHAGVDCLGIRGVVDFRGRWPREFVHSIRYQEYVTRGGVYCRPPYILNPMRRDVASRFAFADVSYAEDAEWALRIARTGALRTEHMLEPVIYRYHSRRHWMLQAAIDLTEPVRRPLGLEFANRVRAGRWLARRRA